MILKTFSAICLFSLACHAAQANEPTLPTQRAETSTNSKSLLSSVVEKGYSFLGIKYRFGGTGPESGGFDCSGLVRKVFGDALGVNLPRTASSMAGMGQDVQRGELKPGDLVFFNTMRRTFSHVGIYVGDNQFLHAPSSGKVVRVDNMDSTYWKKRFTGGRRMVSEADAASLASMTTESFPNPAAAQALQAMASRQASNNQKSGILGGALLATASLPLFGNSSLSSQQSVLPAFQAHGASTSSVNDSKKTCAEPPCAAQRLVFQAKSDIEICNSPLIARFFSSTNASRQCSQEAHSAEKI